MYALHRFIDHAIRKDMLPERRLSALLSLTLQIRKTQTSSDKYKEDMVYRFLQECPRSAGAADFDQTRRFRVLLQDARYLEACQSVVEEKGEEDVIV